MTTAVRSVNVLVVDDNVALANVVANIIRDRNGFVVTVSGGYLHADALLKDPLMHWDLLISDYVMPDGTGIDLFFTLLSKNPKGKTILISAYPQMLVENTELKKGLHYREPPVLNKPFSAKQLNSTIDKLLAEVV